MPSLDMSWGLPVLQRVITKCWKVRKMVVGSSCMRFTIHYRYAASYHQLVSASSILGDDLIAGTPNEQDVVDITSESVHKVHKGHWPGTWAK